MFAYMLLVLLLPNFPAANKRSSLIFYLDLVSGDSIGNSKVIADAFGAKIAGAASTTRANQSDFIEDAIYVPPTFSGMFNNSDAKETDSDSTTSATKMPLDESLFLRTAEKWWNIHLGTLAVALPANNLSEPLLGWHVAIYSKTEMPYRQICGGSLVTKDVVISAAHCFWDDAGLIPAEQFAVVGGKLRREWSQFQINQANVSKIIKPPLFLGINTNFQDDIAIVKLDRPFVYDFGVRPLCVDFNIDLEREQLKNGNMGIILGYGLTEENGEPSEVLNYQNLPYVEINDCIIASELDFLKYLTSDKICAGDQRSGRALCRGDSGGGLVFFVGDPDATTSIPYLRGIASTAPRNQHKCNAYAIGSFTHVRTHRTFLRDNIPGLEEECGKVYAEELALAKRQKESQNKNMSGNKNSVRSEAATSGVTEIRLVTGKQPLSNVDVTLKTPKPNSAAGKQTGSYQQSPDNNLPDGEDSDDESDTDIKMDNNKIENIDKDEKDADILRTLPKHAPTLGASSAPAYQWHVAVYSKFRSPYWQICGGTLVKSNVIISAAHCFFNQSRLLSPELFAVVAGKLHRHWGDPRDEYAQYSDVKQIHVHDGFLAVQNLMGSCYQHDVAVLNLATPFTYAPGVEPACVRFDMDRDLDDLQSGSFGKFVGWGRTDNNCELYPRLSYRELPYVHLGCIEDNPLVPTGPGQSCDVLDIVLADERVPAHVRVPPPCASDSGGGLTYLENSTDIPYLRGVATIHPVNKCNLFILDSFIKLRDEQKFLKAFIPGLEAECAAAYPNMGKEDVNMSGAGTGETKGPGGIQNGNGIAPVAGTQPNDAITHMIGLKPGSNGSLSNKPTQPILNTNRLEPGIIGANPPNTVEPSQKPNAAGNPNVNNYQIADFDNIPFTDPSRDRNPPSRPIVWSRNHTTTENPAMGSVTAPALSNSSGPLFQWHVGVYSKAWTPYMQICGGSLVKRDVVISAAHCFWSDDFGPQSPAQFAVAAGKLHRPWIDSKDVGAQYSHVRELIFPDRFVGIKTNFQDDIAVVQLDTPFEYRPGVKPICVEFDMEAEKEQLRKGRFGMVPGWGLTENDGRLSQRLNYVELPYVEIKECIRNIQSRFLKYITGDKICVGDQSNDKYLCRSDAGGGLAFIDTYPIIRGISSQVFDDLCRSVTTTPFTLISSHATFLRQNVRDIERECVDVYGIIDKRNNGYSGLANSAHINLVCNCNCDDPRRYRP